MRANRVLLPVLVIFAVTAVAAANSLGPPLAHTGAPGVGGRAKEPSCGKSGCHTGNPLNFNGMLEILGLPAAYSPGVTYPVTVRLTSTATQVFLTRRWGFEITGVRLSDGQSTGTFSSPSLRILTFDSRTYVTHDFDDLQVGEVSPAEWTFNWTAPVEDEGDIAFYAAGNAANGTGTSLSDFIYTTSDTTLGDEVPVEPVTWGRIKSLYAK